MCVAGGLRCSQEGTWEIRGPRRRFTYSALMTWVACDRAGRGAREPGLPGPADRWPLVRFAGPADPRFSSTLDLISAELNSGNLVHRYAITGHDGIAGGEGTFGLRSLWYVEALTRGRPGAGGPGDL